METMVPDTGPYRERKQDGDSQQKPSPTTVPSGSRTVQNTTCPAHPRPWCRLHPSPLAYVPLPNTASTRRRTEPNDYGEHTSHLAPAASFGAPGSSPRQVGDGSSADPPPDNKTRSTGYTPKFSLANAWGPGHYGPCLKATQRTSLSWPATNPGRLLRAPSPTNPSGTTHLTNGSVHSNGARPGLARGPIRTSPPSTRVGHPNGRNTSVEKAGGVTCTNNISKATGGKPPASNVVHRTAVQCQIARTLYDEPTSTPHHRAVLIGAAHSTAYYQKRQYGSVGTCPFCQASLLLGVPPTSPPAPPLPPPTPPCD